MSTISVNGEIIYYRTEGNPGDLPLLFLHGAGGTSHKWSAQLSGLSGKYRTIAVDLPGHGSSQGAGFSDLEYYADFTKDFAQALNLSPFILIGHSMGGGITQCFASKYPQMLKAMVLVGTGARLRVQPDLLALFADLQEVNLQSILYYSGTSPEVIAEGEQDSGLTSPLVRYGDFLGCDRFDLRDKISTITTPALILVGAEDKMTPVKYSEYLQEHLAQASTEVIPTAGHMVMLEQPFDVNMAIDTFLHTLGGCSMQF